MGKLRINGTSAVVAKFITPHAGHPVARGVAPGRGRHDHHGRAEGRRPGRLGALARAGPGRRRPAGDRGLAGPIWCAPATSPDEEFTLFAVRGIEAHGLPLLPSGLLYDRGLAYSYGAWLAGLVGGQALPAFRAVSLLCAALSLWVLFRELRRITTAAGATPGRAGRGGLAAVLGVGHDGAVLRAVPAVLPGGAGAAGAAASVVARRGGARVRRGRGPLDARARLHAGGRARRGRAARRTARNAGRGCAARRGSWWAWWPVRPRSSWCTPWRRRRTAT